MTRQRSGSTALMTLLAQHPKVEALGDDDDLLEFVSSASFPKTCVFRRRALSGFHAPPPREPEPEPAPEPSEPELLPPASEPPEP